MQSSCASDLDLECFGVTAIVVYKLLYLEALLRTATNPCRTDNKWRENQTIKVNRLSTWRTTELCLYATHNNRANEQNLETTTSNRPERTQFVPVASSIPSSVVQDSMVPLGSIPHHPLRRTGLLTTVFRPSLSLISVPPPAMGFLFGVGFCSLALAALAFSPFVVSTARIGCGTKQSFEV